MRCPQIPIQIIDELGANAFVPTNQPATAVEEREAPPSPGDGGAENDHCCCSCWCSSLDVPPDEAIRGAGDGSPGKARAPGVFFAVRNTRPGGSGPAKAKRNSARRIADGVDDSVPSLHFVMPSAFATGRNLSSDKRPREGPVWVSWRRAASRAGDTTRAIPGGYLASSTSVSVPGPSPTMRTQASSSLAPSQCTCLPKCVTKLPLGMGTILSLSTLLPVATHHVPLTTVMKRSLGWKCGLLKLPGLNRLRTT